MARKPSPGAEDPDRRAPRRPSSRSDAERGVREDAGAPARDTLRGARGKARVGGALDRRPPRPVLEQALDQRDSILRLVELEVRAPPPRRSCGSRCAIVRPLTIMRIPVRANERATAAARAPCVTGMSTVRGACSSASGSTSSPRPGQSPGRGVARAGARRRRGALRLQWSRWSAGETRRCSPQGRN